MNDRKIDFIIFNLMLHNNLIESTSSSQWKITSTIYI